MMWFITIGSGGSSRLVSLWGISENFSRGQSKIWNTINNKCCLSKAIWQLNEEVRNLQLTTNWGNYRRWFWKLWFRFLAQIKFLVTSVPVLSPGLADISIGSWQFQASHFWFSCWREQDTLLGDEDELYQWWERSRYSLSYWGFTAAHCKENDCIFLPEKTQKQFAFFHPRNASCNILC